MKPNNKSYRTLREVLEEKPPVLKICSSCKGEIYENHNENKKKNFLNGSPCKCGK